MMCMTMNRFSAGSALLFLCLIGSMMKPVSAKAALRQANHKQVVPTDFPLEQLPSHIDIDKQARIIDFPILSLSEGDLSAIQLAIPYNASVVEFLGITSPIPESGMAYEFVDNELQFRWTRRIPADIHRGDTLALLKLYFKRKPNQHLDRYVSLNTTGCKAVRADGKERTDTDWQVSLPTVTFSTDMAKTHGVETADNTVSKPREAEEENFCTETAHDTVKSAHKRETLLKQQGAEWNQFEILSVIPNPTKTWADITYSISGDCSVYLKLFSPLNQEVMTLVNSGRRTGLYRHNITVSDVAAGIYFLRLETCRDDVQELSDVMKVVVRE